MTKKKRKLKKPVIILIIVLVLLIVGIVLFFTLGRINITLNGDKDITLNYNEPYTEQGASAKYLWFDVNNIIIDDALNLDTSKVGKYEITYKAEFGPIKTSTKRTIEVVDTKEDIQEEQKEIEQVNLSSVDERILTIDDMLRDLENERN